MGRPKSIKRKKKISFWYTEEEINRLDAYANLLGLSRSEFVGFLTRPYVELKLKTQM
jgi:hypothetical protein